MSGLRRAALLWGPVAAYAGLITYLSHTPAPPIPAGISDKLLHVLEYALLGALVARALAAGTGWFAIRPASGGAVAMAAAAGCAAFGAIDEYHQSFVAGRRASAADVLADAVGAGLGAGAVVLIARRRGGSAAGRARSGAAQPVTVELITRDGCHLCEEAAGVLDAVLPEFGLRHRTLDIDRDPGLARAWGEQIPVVLVNGRKTFKHRVDPQRLRRKLMSLGAAAGGGTGEQGP